MVLAILGLLIVAVVTPQVLKYLGRAKTDTARIEIRTSAPRSTSSCSTSAAIRRSRKGCRRSSAKPRRPAIWDGPYLKSDACRTIRGAIPTSIASPARTGDTTSSLGADSTAAQAVERHGREGIYADRNGGRAGDRGADPGVCCRGCTAAATTRWPAARARSPARCAWRAAARSANGPASFAIDLASGFYRHRARAAQRLPSGSPSLSTPRRKRLGDSSGAILFFPDGSSTGGGVASSSGPAPRHPGRLAHRRISVDASAVAGR